MFDWAKNLRQSSNSVYVAPPPPAAAAAEKITVNRLTLFLSNGSKIWWDATPWDLQRKDINTPWLHFYKWYLNCQGSPAYIMKWDDGTHRGETMIRRDLIVSFDVDIITTEAESKEPAHD